MLLAEQLTLKITPILPLTLYTRQVFGLTVFALILIRVWVSMMMLGP